MDFKTKLKKARQKNQSRLCVGLDPDISKIPAHLKKNIFEFNKSIIDATVDQVCAYKPNIAFYEAEGAQGLEALHKTIEHIAGRVPVILDAKRGDIGNTARAYARSIFEDFKADAVTLSPYMGLDSLEPFLNYKDKGIFLLCLTSNPGAADFQKPDLYKNVAKRSMEWNKKYGNIGLVVGATNSADIQAVRAIAADLPFLVPGVGAQGGSLEDVLAAEQEGLVIVNSSRSIIYAGQGKDFAEQAQAIVVKLNQEMNNIKKIS